MRMPQGRKQKRTVERMCVACRQRFPQKELMRLVLQEDGKARLDLKSKAQGRGLYLCHSYACLEKVLAPKGKGRPPLLLEAESRAILEGLHAMRKEGEESEEPKTSKFKRLLGQARKAGQLSLGFDAVSESLRKGEVKLLLLASDLGPSSLAKLRPSLQAHPVQTLTILNKEELAKCLGRSSLALCGVRDEGFAQAILTALLGKQPSRQNTEKHS